MYIQTPTSGFDGFKDDYLEETGEAIQSTPLMNTEETHYLIGSSRITQDNFNALVEVHTDISISDDVPDDWVTKEDE